MAFGLIRKFFTEKPISLGGTYAYNDIRLKSSVVRQLVDELVATGLWSIVNEEVPTSNFTSSSTNYRIWIKFKNSDHVIQLYSSGNSTSLTIFLYQAGNLSSTIKSVPISTNTGQDGTPAQLGITLLYGDSWCVFGLVPYAVTSLKDFLEIGSVSIATWFGGFTYYEAENPSIETEAVYFSDTNNPITNFVYYVYLTGINTTTSRPNLIVPKCDNNTNLLMAVDAKANTNLRVKDNFSFTNQQGYVSGSIIKIDGDYYWLANKNLILKLKNIVEE